MSSKPDRSVRPKGPPSGQRPARPGAPRASARDVRRTRQILAMGIVALGLIAAVAFVLVSQAQQPALAADRHALGKADAPVTVTEWSDYQ